MPHTQVLGNDFYWKKKGSPIHSLCMRINSLSTLQVMYRTTCSPWFLQYFYLSKKMMKPLSDLAVGNLCLLAHNIYHDQRQADTALCPHIFTTTTVKNTTSSKTVLGVHYQLFKHLFPVLPMKHSPILLYTYTASASDLYSHRILTMTIRFSEI